MMQLHTFLFSHYAERARWALDLSGREYTERRLLPGVHWPIIRRIAPKTTIPVLVHDAKVVQGSGAILDYLQQRLGATLLAPPPAAARDCAKIEELAERAFGLGTSRIFYATMLHHRDELLDMWTQGGPSWGHAYCRVTFPLIAIGTRRNYAIRADTVEEAKDLFRRAMDTTDRALADGPYLVGDQISRADITVASLLSIMARPKEHVARWPDAWPLDLGDFVAELEDRPTWKFVLRMYREHRQATGGP